MRSAASALTKAGTSLKAGPSGVGVTATVAGLVEVPKVAESAFVAPTATLAGPVVVDASASVWYGASVTGPVLVGPGAAVGCGATVTGATTLGDHASLGARSSVANAKIGARATIEPCATVFGTVGADARVAAGSLVPTGMSVPDGELWAGSPAVFVQKIEAVDVDPAFEALTLAHADEVAKPYTQLLEEEEKWADAQERHPRYFQPDAPDHLDGVSVQGVGVPGRIMNNQLSSP